MDAAERVRGWLSSAERVTVLTGAGISTDSGIPDFRGPQGVWTKDPRAERMFTFDAYVSDPELRVTAWRNRAAHPAWHAQPNAGHLALVELERAGRLHAIVTQNIDGLHQRAGSSVERVIEIHGTLSETECLDCDRRVPMSAALERVAAGDADPSCEACGGIQKAATISFGQSLRPEVLDAAVRAAAQCDLFLAIGTSLLVQPAAALCDVSVRNGARLVIVNAEPTPYDARADAVLRRPIGDLLPELVRA